MAVSPEEQRRLADALTRALSDQQTAQELLNQANATGIDLEQRKLELKQAVANAAQAEYESTNAAGTAGIDVLAQLKARASALTREYEDATTAAREFSSTTQAIAGNVRGMLGITTQWRGNTIAAFAAARASGKGLIQTLQEAREEYQKTVTAAERAGSSAMKVTEIITGGWTAAVAATVKLASGLDQAAVAFNRATGAAPAFASQIVALEDKMNAFGVNADRASRAMSSLYSGSSAFTNMAPQMRQSVLESVAVLDVLGIEAGASVRNIEVLTRAMGMTGSQAAATNERMFAVAQQFGISTSKMIEGFAAAAPEMMKFGSRAVDVYTRLQLVAKQTGLEVDRMMAIVSKFDRFDTAAESVGNLNAVLGGPFLNSMRMVMMTDPTERMMALAGAVKQAGLSFENMGYYMRQTVANRMGLQNVQELAIVMNGNFQSLNGQIVDMSSNSAQLRNQTERFNSVAEEFAQVARLLAISLYPLVDVLKTLAQFLQENQFIVKAFIPAIIGLKGAMFAVQLGTMAYVGGLGSLAAALGPVILVVGALALAFAKLNSTGDGLFGISSGINQIAASVNAVPESKTTKFTQLVEKTDQLAGKNVALGAAATQGLAMSAVGGARGGVVTKVTQPINVDLSIGEDHIMRRIVNVLQEFRH